MYEKVNPFHPDKVADRIAGAIVDLAYTKAERPKIAVEVLLGHGQCNVIIETSEDITADECHAIVQRIAGYTLTYTKIVKQDEHLARNQADEVRCGDNGIFRGTPVTSEQQALTEVARKITDLYGTDGKYIINGSNVIICQSNMDDKQAKDMSNELKLTYGCRSLINPLGFWTGGTNVDAGATNRKLGSDMGDAVTGGGLHGKDLSKADVSVNIVCHLLAQEKKSPVSACCAIGDDMVTFHIEETYETKVLLYETIVQQAQKYIKELGGFEKFAEWGLIN